MVAKNIEKGTKVDRVYDKNHKEFDAAKKYDTISYEKLLYKNINIRVMDMAAFDLAKESNNQIVISNATNANKISQSMMILEQQLWERLEYGISL